MASSKAALFIGKITVASRSNRRDVIELAIAFGLIMIVIWTPRPWQILLWFIAATYVAGISCLRFEGLEPMGLRTANLLRSLWVVGAALAVAGIAGILASRLHTLHLPNGPILFIRHFGRYALWACVQQFMLQCFLLSRLERLIQNASTAAAMAAAMFAVTHLPSPILTTVTLICGLASCLLFLRYRNLFPVAIAHAVLGITVAVTIPAPVDHDMLVGLNYLTYTVQPETLSQP